jgi:uncharacterized protein YndB with AHSA1/START domain
MSENHGISPKEVQESNLEKENRISVTIDKPIGTVFEFTTNPKNTHLWFSTISEETAEKYPPEIDTIYRNRGGEDSEWNEYKVVEFQENKVFALSDGNYTVRYSYRGLEGNKTEMEYWEWVNEGDLTDPLSEDVLKDLKEILEKL